MIFDATCFFILYLFVLVSLSVCEKSLPSAAVCVGRGCWP